MAIQATQQAVLHTVEKAAPTWRRVYSRRIALTDILVLIIAVIGAEAVWLGLGSRIPGQAGSAVDVSGVSYTEVSIVIIVAWLAALAVFDARDYRILGVGNVEYRRIFGASFALFGVIAIVAYLLRIGIARGFISIAFPAGIMLLILSRWLWRQWLVQKRRKGKFLTRVVVVGSKASVENIAAELRRKRSAGYRVVAACLPQPIVGTLSDGVTPIIGGIDNVSKVLEDFHADTAVIASSDELSPRRIRQISWGLDPNSQHLLIAPNLTDVVGPRVHMRQVEALPLIDVEIPRYEGVNFYAKRVFDVAIGSIAVLLLSPVMLVVALLVRLDSPGPVLFRQARVGINGQSFTMLKFRTMVVDAEARLAALEKQQRDAGNTILFKMKDDPRITRIGKVLRKFSIDELPQLLNVIGGSMSLVGPRPSLQREVDQYEPHVHRRLLVKPGITGEWQVGGRSNLSWEESVRLDLYYVENWSITGDLLILLKTVRAVFQKDGAY
jgi:exopolysaccharide biosynthesis polyprenyl glycosylphosphotransferase